MKKIYSLLFIAITSIGYSQFSENFDAVTTPGLPAGWASFRGSNDLGTGFDWTTAAAPRANTAPNCAFVRYELGAPGDILEDWLITPLIDLTNYSGASLTFYGNQQYTADYGTVYEIKVSTSSQTNISSFANVQTYGETDFLFTTTPMTATALKTIDLSAYNGQQIYVAFVMTQNDGDNWFIDTVGVTGTLSTISFDNQVNSVYPNPTTGLVTINSNESIESVKVFGMLGNVIKTYKNTNTIDLSGLEIGSYFVSIVTVGGKVTTRKIIKK